MVEVLSGVNLATLVPLILKIVRERRAQLCEGQRRVRRPSLQGASEIDINKDTPEVKEQGFRRFGRHVASFVRPNAQVQRRGRREADASAGTVGWAALTAGVSISDYERKCRPQIGLFPLASIVERKPQ
jgi:hypothetical protein